jgi:integrase
MAQRLTAVTVRNLRPEDKKYEVMDAENPGFGVWVYPSGKKAFVYAYRCNGKKGRITLDSESLAEARDQYRELRQVVRRGIDPKAQRAEERRQQEQELTFGRLAQRYLDEHASRKRSGDEDKRLLNLDVLPRWQNLKAKDIRRRDVQEMLKAIIDRGSPIVANRVLAVTRKVFNWGIEQDLIEANPCVGIKAPAKERSADRVLSDSEIKIFWNDLQLSPQIHTALKLELLLAQRIGEILGMRWDELDFEQNIWTLSPDRTKNETVHVVPLPKQAVTLIEQMRILSGASDYVFASPRQSKQGNSSDESSSATADGSRTRKPIRSDSVGTALSRAIQEAELDHFSSHDLRRTAATNISALGYSDELVGRILNHANHTVTARYNRHAHLAEKRAALEAWASRLAMQKNSQEEVDS